jgi:hypothetical protein
MKKLLAVLAAMVVLTGTAQAQVITREGSDYNGYANPDGCNILVHTDEPAELHVNCKKVDGVARIRYRFLRDVDGEFKPADVSVDWEKHGAGSSASVRWMVPTPRTVRVVVTGYVHIVSVTWDQ